MNEPRVSPARADPVLRGRAHRAAGGRAAGPATDWALFAVAAGLTVLIAAVGTVAVRIGRGRPLVLIGSLAYLVAVAVLRHSGTTGGRRLRAADAAPDRLPRAVRHAAASC